MSDTMPMEEVEDCVCEAETAKACLIRTPSGLKVWVPKSLIGENSEVWSAKKDQNEGTLHVARWFAEKEGLG